jgi:hypothetical protein
MRNLIIRIAALVVVGGSALAQSGLPQEPQKTSTRFGSLTVGEDRMLLFKGQKLSPPIEGNNSLNLGEVFQIGATDVVLVMDNGGTACPYLYYFISVTKAGAVATPSFGTCGELGSIRRSGNSISVTMPGYLGPFEPDAKRRKAARERHVFIFHAGVVTENGKPVK